MSEVTFMRGLYWRTVLLLAWMSAIAIAVAMLPHPA
jgi:hypothetical protein